MPVRLTKSSAPLTVPSVAAYAPIPLDALDVADLESLESVYFTLANLCQLLRRARVARARGRNTEAQKLESSFEHLYSGLPSFAKW